MQVTRTILSQVIIFIIYFYQKTISPDHGAMNIFFNNNRCRFYPSCSAYTMQAVRQYGLLKGSVVSSKRIFRCNPWRQGGYDPVS